MVRRAPGHLSERELASELGLSVWALRAWRRKGYGPQAIRIGNAVFYSETEVAAFLSRAKKA